MTTRRQGAHGVLYLITKANAASSVGRTVRLEANADGSTLLLVDIETRKSGAQREVRYEITPAELIAMIRAEGAELPSENNLVPTPRT
jgi:hypothetical protein